MVKNRDELSIYLACLISKGLIAFVISLIVLFTDNSLLQFFLLIGIKLNLEQYGKIEILQSCLLLEEFENFTRTLWYSFFFLISSTFITLAKYQLLHVIRDDVLDVHNTNSSNFVKI